MSLVYADLAIGRQIVKVLVCVDAGTLGCRPRRRVHGDGALGRVARLGPGDEQGDGVFCLGDAAQVRGHALGRRGRHLDGQIAQLLDHGVADVDVVAVEVVRDVRLPARPRFEGLELVLGLRHVAVEVVEVAERLGLEPGVRVGRVEALVVLDKDVHTLFAGAPQQVLVMGELLDGGLGEKHMDAALDGVQRNGIVRRVGGEYGDGVAGGETVNGRLVGVWVLLVVGREAVEGGVEPVVDLGDIFVQVLAWRLSHELPELEEDEVLYKNETYEWRETWSR